MVCSMIINVKLCVNNERKQDRNAGVVEIIDGKKYITLNVHVDSGEYGSILELVI